MAKSRLTVEQALDVLAETPRRLNEQRIALLAYVEALPPDAWSRRATVIGADAPLERTVTDYLVRMALHERAHQAQLASTAAGPVPSAP